MFRIITTSAILLSLGCCFMSCDTAEVKRLQDGRSTYYADGKKLSGKSVVEGYVVDATTKKGIKNARVEMKNANMGVGYYERETEWNGYFKIDDFIPYVKYIVEASAQGYVTHASTGTIAVGTNTIELKPEAVLTGVVKNTKGEPLRGVEIKLSSYAEYDEESGEGGENGIGKPLIAASDSAGSYRFDKLPAGSYLATFI